MNGNTWRRSFPLIVVLALGLALVPSPAKAAAGDLDLTFGADGTVTTDFARADDFAWDVAVLPDGGLLAVGSTGTYPDGDFALAKYTPDGLLDPSFGAGGRVTTDFGSTNDQAYAAAVQPDGKIVVAGYTFQDFTPDWFALARYNADGTLDPTFGSAGLVKAHVGPGADQANEVALQPDGKIVAVGIDRGSPDGAFAVARFLPTGALDPTFGTGGSVLTQFGTGDDGATDVAIQPDGRIMTVGWSTNVDSTTDFALARYTAHGVLDTSFSGDGKGTTDFASWYDTAWAVALQADGRIVVAGDATTSGLALARYQPTGNLDPTFGGDGKVTGGPDLIAAYGLSIDSAGRILTTGPGAGPVSTDFAVARWNGDGTLDGSFGMGGVALVDFGRDVASGSADEPHDLALEADGSIIVAGQSPTGTLDFAVAHLSADGAIDSSFGGSGFVITNLGTWGDFAVGVTTDAAGRIVMAGTDGVDMIVARYQSNGFLDSSFGVDGLARADFGAINKDAVTEAMAIQPDGKIVVAGYAYGAAHREDFALARFDDMGRLDPSFGTSGRVVTDFGTDYDAATSVVLQQDVKLLVAGDAGGAFALARYTSDGQLDSTFGNGGRVKRSNPGTAYGVALQPDGKILTTGYAVLGSTAHFAVVRLTSSGQLDPTFGRGGVFVTKFGAYSSVAVSPAVQLDGKIVALGTAGAPSPNLVLVRLLVGGTLDPSFGNNGRVVTDVEGHDDEASKTLLQSDGKIVGVGTCLNAAYIRTFCLARWNPDGTLDASLGGDGTVTTDLAYDEQRALGGALDESGRILVTGLVRQGSDQDAVVARYSPS